jgi:hypothetical protein
MFPADTADTRRKKIMTENEVSYIIRGAIFKVYNTLGPDYLNRYMLQHWFTNSKKKG